MKKLLVIAFAAILLVFAWPTRYEYRRLQDGATDLRFRLGRMEDVAYVHDGSTWRKVGTTQDLDIRFPEWKRAEPYLPWDPEGDLIINPYRKKQRTTIGPDAASGIFDRESR